MPEEARFAGARYRQRNVADAQQDLADVATAGGKLGRVAGRTAGELKKRVKSRDSRSLFH
jgi:hypothetical protein